MGRKWIAALLAAVSVLPVAAAAQERGDRHGGREARQQMRPQGGGAMGGWQQRQAQRPAPPAQRPAPQMERPAPQMQRPASQAGMQRPAPPAGWTGRGEARQQRSDNRRAFDAERQRDRQALAAGQVTREQYRSDRLRDRSDFRRDQQQDRQAYRGNWQQQRQWSDASRREDGHRWARSGADWADHGRWQGQPGWNGNRGGGGWSRDWRRDTRYDWNRWRTVNRNAFRLPRYYAPYGWNYGYRQFGIGATLSAVLFAQNYWINDPYAYRLPEAYDPYRWVRYYNDALLVDTYTGEVVDVIHDIFW